MLVVTTALAVGLGVIAGTTEVGQSAAAVWNSISSAGQEQAPAPVQIATIETDKSDYQPGDIVIITGSGWQPGEDALLNFHQDMDPQFRPDLEYPVTADAGGNLFSANFALEYLDL